MPDWGTIKEWIAEKRKFMFIGAGLIIVALMYMYNERSASFPQMSGEEDGIGATGVNDVESEGEMSATRVEENERMMVDVKGAVKHPGVYEVDEGERVIDAIKKSGGFTDEADVDRINLSERVSDEMVIYVPEIGEEISFGQSEPDKDGSEKIDINEADTVLLQTLPGIGPTRAEAIIEYRNENGPFTSIEELMKITGIGEKTFEKLKDRITVR